MWSYGKALPFASLVALLLSWTGVGLFCLKMYRGVEAFQAVASDTFTFLLPWLKLVKTSLVALAAVMLLITTLMCLVGFFSTRQLKASYAGQPSPWLCTKFGGRFTCGLFCLLSYSLNVCWLGILCITVSLISTYLIFWSICLPHAGREAESCFNFTLLSTFLAGGRTTSSVNMILCGQPVSQFCKLTQALAPWYWSAFLGCFAVLLGLSHFNGCLAANFAHSKHARTYRKLHRHEHNMQCDSASDHDQGTKLSAVEKQLVEGLLRKLQQQPQSLHETCV